LRLAAKLAGRIFLRLRALARLPFAVTTSSLIQSEKFAEKSRATSLKAPRKMRAKNTGQREPVHAFHVKGRAHPGLR
jgi:hypothetical protein